jgi:hypothetical protein
VIGGLGGGFLAYTAFNDYKKNGLASLKKWWYGNSAAPDASTPTEKSAAPRPQTEHVLEIVEMQAQITTVEPVAEQPAATEAAPATATAAPVEQPPAPEAARSASPIPMQLDPTVPSFKDSLALIIKAREAAQEQQKAQVIAEQEQALALAEQASIVAEEEACVAAEVKARIAAEQEQAQVANELLEAQEQPQIAAEEFQSQEQARIDEEQELTRVTEEQEQAYLTVGLVKAQEQADRAARIAKMKADAQEAAAKENLYRAKLVAQENKRILEDRVLKRKNLAKERAAKEQLAKGPALSSTTEAPVQAVLAIMQSKPAEPEVAVLAPAPAAVHFQFQAPVSVAPQPAPAVEELSEDEKKDKEMNERGCLHRIKKGISYYWNKNAAVAPKESAPINQAPAAKKGWSLPKLW